MTTRAQYQELALNLVALYLPQIIAGALVMRHGYEPLLMIPASVYGVGGLVSGGNTFVAVLVGIEVFAVSFTGVIWLSVRGATSLHGKRMIRLLSLCVGVALGFVGIGVFRLFRASW
jgi:hypothetical protein